MEHRAIETLRDIHDKTDVPVVLIGMANANRKLMRYKHILKGKVQPSFDTTIKILRDLGAEIEVKFA